MSKLKFKEIADAIREKEHSTEPIPANEFATRIRNLASSGVGGANGEYNIETAIEADGTQTLKITDWDYVPPKHDSVFANNTPEQVNIISEEIANNGYTSAQVAEIYRWNLGDTIPITLTSGETIEMQIIGFNHDTLSSDHTSKAGITLQMKDCLATSTQMNSSSTNAGGYAASKMKTETLPTLKALLPQEWQSVIKLVDKKSANGGGVNFTKVVTTSEDIFLLSAMEAMGATGASGFEAGTEEGVWYEYYSDGDTSKLIRMRDTDGDGVPETGTKWWTRSSRLDYDTSFGRIDNRGYIGNALADNKNQIAFAFCI